MKKIRQFLHHYIIPSYRNNYKAKALHLDTLTVLVALWAVISFSAQGAHVLGFATDINLNTLLERTNQERANGGLGGLSYNAQLASAAQNKAAHMLANNYWDHFGPDGTSPWDFINNSGYSYKYAGENLAYNFMFSNDVVVAWMESPTHRENIMRPEYTEVGFGMANGTLLGEETTVVVQMFGTPNAAQPVAQVQEQSFVPAANAQEEVAQIAPQSLVAETKPQVNDSKSAPVETKTEDPIQAELQQNYNSQPPLVIGATEKSSASISRFIPDVSSFSFNSSTFIITLLLFIFLMDLVIAHKLKIMRVSSKNFAHIIFLSTVLIGIYLVRSGAIL